MGLFSTLTTSQEATATVRSSSSSSSLTLPTVVQLYGGKSAPLKLLQGVASTKDASHIPTFAVLTYQAVPTVALQSAVLEHQKQAGSGPTTNTSSNATTQKHKAMAILKRIEQAAPDLGVWNCKVQKAMIKTTTTAAASSADGTAPPSTTAPLLVDSLLQIPTVSKTFCFTIDLSNQSQVEPTITRLQEALVRYMIANGKEINKAAVEDAIPTDTTGGGGVATEENASPNTSSTSVCTTSLFQLRSVQFGLAEMDEAMKTSTAPDASDHNVKVALLICAQLGGSSRSSSSSSGDKSADTPEGSVPSETSDYKYKQGQALLIYHLRKYAAALNANLCFVQASPSGLFDENTAAPATSATTTADSSNNSTDPPALTYPQVGLVWRALAQGQDISKDITSILEMEEPSTSTAVVETSEENKAESSEAPKEVAEKAADDNEGAHSLVYGPGNSQSDLIESVLLRHAHYPGHWDASKESVWAIFPASQESAVGTKTSTAASGDEGWLSEIRDSIAGVTASLQSPEPKKKDDSKVQQTPDATTDFFKSLLTPGD